MPNVIPIEVGLTKSRIVGNVPPEIYQALRDQVSFQVDGYFFNPRYKSRQWDGRRHLITEKGQQFATGLVSRVSMVLGHLGYEPQIIDKRHLGPPAQFMPMLAGEPLREYQQHAVRKMIEAGMGTCRIATGGGKTRVGIAVIADLERPALFLVHRRDLMHQTLGVLRKVMQYPELVGQVGDGVYEPNMITVATIQSICAALSIKADDGEKDDEKPDTGAAAHRKEIEKMLETVEVVIGDECHHAPASTIYKVLEKCKHAPYRVGLSATDWRDDGADMMIEAAFGPRIVDIDLSALIGWKFLVPPEIWMNEMAMPTSKLAGVKSRNWNSVYSHFVTLNEAYHKQVVEQAREWYWHGRTVLTLVERVQHGQILEEMMNARGVESVFLSGKDSVDKRMGVFNDVMSGKLRSLVATSIADEGLDLPALDALILAGGSKSSTRAYQRIGRIIRPYRDKDKGLVADYRCRDHEWLDEHARTRIRIYKRERAFVLHAKR